MIERSYKWLVIALLWLVCFFNYADRQAIFSVFPLLKQDLRLSDTQLALAGSSFMWVYALCGPFAGWLGDRVSRKKMITSALVFWSLVTAATALSHGIYDLTLWRAMGGFGEAFYFPAAMSLISDYHGPATRSRAMAIHQSSVYAGSIAGATLSGYLGESYGWRMSFVCFGLSGIGVGILLLLLLREPLRSVGASSAAASFLNSAPAVLSRPMARVLIAVFAGANFVAAVFLTWLPSFLHDKFRMSLSGAGWNSTVYLQIASVCGVLLGGILADRSAQRSGSRARVQVIGLLCGVPFLWICGRTFSLGVLAGALTAFGFFKGLYDANIFASLHDVVPGERRAAATGLMNSIGWLGGGFAPVIIAALAAGIGMSLAISLTAGIYLIAGLTLFFFSRPARRGTSV